MTLINKKSVPLLVLFLFGISMFLYESSINLFPSYIHAWTQSDRYAIALRFLDNGFDFFHPATFNLQTVHGITRVDFPINEFIVALLMKLFGTTAPIVFRVYTLCISIFGLAYLYLFSKKATGSEIKSWLIVLFVFFSPVYFYYQNGFIPSVPAIACLFVAYYYFFLYKESKIKKQFLIAIFFFLLAALMRFPFLVFLTAICLQQCWMMFRERKIKTNEILGFVAAFALFVSYYFYNVHLGRMYGNMFLDYFMPAKSISEFKEIVSEMIHHWGLHYYTYSHYALLFFVLVFTLLQFIKQKSIFNENKKYWFHLFIVACGVSCYFLMMARQYYAHDYYFLDSFYVPIVLFLVFSLINIKMDTVVSKTIWTSVFIVHIVLFYVFSEKTQSERYYTGPWDRAEISRQNFIGTEKCIDGLGIPKDAKILVIDAYTTNAPLILMNRKGYTVLGTTAKNISSSLFGCDWDYVAIQDLYLVSDVIKSYPFITSVIERIGGNGRVSFYKKSKTVQQKSLKQFLRITDKNTFNHTIITFDSVGGLVDPHVSSIGESFVTKNHKSFFAMLNDKTEFGTTISIKASELKNENNLKILVFCDILANELIDNVQLVAAVRNKTKTVFYQNFFLKDYFKQSSDWKRMEFQFVLPEFETPDDEVGVYFWNPEKMSFSYDNFEVIFYK